MRNLVRARFDAKKAERTARAQPAHFLLRHGFRYSAKTSWTKAHLEWIRFCHFEHQAQERVLVDYLHVVEEAAERIRSLEDDIGALVQS